MKEIKRNLKVDDNSYVIEKIMLRDCYLQAIVIEHYRACNNDGERYIHCISENVYPSATPTPTDGGTLMYANHQSEITTYGGLRLETRYTYPLRNHRIDDTTDLYVYVYQLTSGADENISIRLFYSDKELSEVVMI